MCATSGESAGKEQEATKASPTQKGASKLAIDKRNVRLVYECSMEAKARALGATSLSPSWRRNKKLAVTYRGRWIHLGQLGYDDYTTHRDPVRRANYRRRHRGILLADGRPAYTVKTTPAFWAYHVLW